MQFFDSGTPKATVAVGSFGNRFSNRFFSAHVFEYPLASFDVGTSVGTKKLLSVLGATIHCSTFFEKSLIRSVIQKSARNLYFQLF